MKKFWIVMMTLVAALCLCFGLTACGEKDTPVGGQNNNTQTEQPGGDTPSGDEPSGGEQDEQPDDDDTDPDDGPHPGGDEGGDEGGEEGGDGEGDEEHEHSYSELWTSDETDHWHVANCGHTAIKDKAAHTYVNGVCSTCNYAHENHAFGNWVEREAPTCTVDGYREHTCSVCGKVEQQTLTHSGHSYENGICSVCGSVEELVTFRTLQVNDDDTVYGKVSNRAETFSFIQEVVPADGVTFTVSFDLNGIESIPTKTVSLEIGDNTYYVLASRGNLLKLYTVTVRRRPVYSVTFETSGSAVEPQQVEEDQNIVQPAASERTGYTFRNWTLNGNAVTFPYTVEEGIPQTSGYNVTFTAVFTANEYKATLDAKGGEVSNGEQTVTFDQSYNFPVPTRTGYTFLGWYEGENQLTNAEGASLSAWAYDEGKQIDAHWSANSYRLTVEKNLSDAGTVTGGGTFAYDSDVTVTATTKRLGYDFLGWYNEKDERVSEQASYTFPMGLEQTITAKWQVAPEMENFNFSSNSTTCTISGVKDTAVTGVIVPDYVTGISGGAFKGCSHVESITLPFVGGSRKTASDTYQYPFGYIFGTSSFSGASAVWQQYYGSSTSSITSSTYYIPDSLKNVTVVGGEILRGAFYNCSRLKSVTIGNGVTSIGYDAFEGCSGLTGVTIPDSVTSIGEGAFYDCGRLTKVHITDLAAWCRIDFGSEYANPLYYAHHLYLGGNEIKDLVIPNEVTEIKKYAFENCDGLTSVTIHDSVASIGGSAFEDCNRLESITVATGNPNYSSQDGILYNKAKTEIVHVPQAIKGSIIIPDSVTEIKRHAFYNCGELTSVKLKNGQSPKTAAEINVN